MIDPVFTSGYENGRLRCGVFGAGTKHFALSPQYDSFLPPVLYNKRRSNELGTGSVVNLSVNANGYADRQQDCSCVLADCYSVS